MVLIVTAIIVSVAVIFAVFIGVQMLTSTANLNIPPFARMSYCYWNLSDRERKRIEEELEGLLRKNARLISFYSNMDESEALSREFQEFLRRNQEEG